MKIFPAIDLKSGQCVRLNKGDFNQITYYSQDPVSVAQNYQKYGAKYLHIVDLDGAKNSELSQLDIILNIRKSTNLFIQVGGGIKSQAIVAKLLNSGINRVIIGSKAIKNISGTKDLFKEFGNDKIVLALDVNINIKDIPMVATHGWQQASELSLWQLIDEYQDVKLKHVLCTDIDRDGMLTGPNFSLYKQTLKKYPHIALQASGGISGLNDLSILQQNNIAAVIIGKALYENKFTLTAALNEILVC